MIIRPAVEKDIPGIVELLKMTLGEDATVKSENYWNWKHVENPFGPSPVILGFEGGQLVGIRAFMRWKWKRSGKIYEAVRAVDTATHPDHQGKGIFSKLTRALLQECQDKKWDFVFNTPNKASKPGYIKMGWTEAGRLPVTLNVDRPVQMVARLAGLTTTEPAPATNEAEMNRYLSHPGLENLLQANEQHYKDFMFTDHSTKTLAWRYRSVTVKQYFAAALEIGNAMPALVFYRIKPGRAGTELRVTDVFAEDAKWKRDIDDLIRTRVKMHHAHFVTFSDMNEWISRRKFFRINGLPIGPIVTVRNISGPYYEVLQNFAFWRPSMGDLELF
ncbi:MAG TPA: GNAT family N-acetyltransferase [Chryseosolibacter sp.]|nr:GNAT family N-acetyltransferase [Chryseosolibacter sp.]